jgi:hypothetical protein
MSTTPAMMSCSKPAEVYVALIQEHLTGLSQGHDPVWSPVRD